MKKIIYIILGLILIASVTAVIYATKESALSAWDTRQEQIDLDIATEQAKVNSTLSYDTDCIIDKDRRIKCYVIINYTFNNKPQSIKMNIEEKDLDGNTLTGSDIEELVRNEINLIVKKDYKENNPVEDIHYDPWDINDKEIDLR